MLITRSIDLPLCLYGSHDAKKIDNLATTHFAVSGYELMCKAGQAALNYIQNTWPQAKSLDILCGKGNNGGDGLTLARLAKAKGFAVTVYQIGTTNEAVMPVEAKAARQAWLEIQGEINAFTGQALTADLIVDALLGVGAHAPLGAEFQDAIMAMNESHQKILALDLPSGLNIDTGTIFDFCVKATATITFIVMKMGLLCYQGIEHVGDLVFDDLGIDVAKLDVRPMAYRLSYQDLIANFPVRRLASHKGDYGHVCVIGGGESGFSGAVCLAGEAALRAGAGLVSAVVSPESLPLLARAPAELMSYGLKSPKTLTPIIERATVIVLGTGLGKTKWASHFFQATLKSTKPKVIDADGLNWLAQFPQKHENWILTPHPKEAARLLGVSTESILQDRLSAARLLKEKYGGVIVLKGAGTIIIDQDNNAYLNEGGYPSLATGGTGDVLAGLIGGLLAQGLSLAMAARIGVNIHTQAAALEQSLGARGMLASDLFLPIRALLNPYENFQATRVLNG